MTNTACAFPPSVVHWAGRSIFHERKQHGMHEFDEIEVFDCPLCRGPGLLQEEGGWCVYVECMDCGARTAELSYRTAEERLEAARRVASTWNMGKVIHPGPGD